MISAIILYEYYTVPSWSTNVTHYHSYKSSLDLISLHCWLMQYKKCLTTFWALYPLDSSKNICLPVTEGGLGLTCLKIKLFDFRLRFIYKMKGKVSNISLSTYLVQITNVLQGIFFFRIFLKIIIIVFTFEGL